MQYYFFKTPKRAEAEKFKQYAVRQNIAISNIMSITIIGTCISLLIVRIFVETRFTISHIEGYRYVTLFLLSGSFLYRALFYLTKKGLTKQRFNVYWVLSSFYALIIACGFMWLTFIAQHNPRNTLTMFVSGMFVVSVLWILDIWGTLSISLVVFTSFMLFLHLFQTDISILFQNYVALIIVLVVFFVISRVIYSYHFRYYIQLITIVDKNKEIKSIYQKHTNILDAVAHDLRSPLNSISGLVEIIRFPSVTEQEKEEYYDMILSACGDADHILHDVIDAARKNEDEMIDKTPMSLNSFIDSIQKKWEHRVTGEKHFEFTIPDEVIVAAINEQKMRRVIDNLINNAIKFTKSDGLISIGLTTENNMARISVSDNGIGIPKNLQPYIFDRFTHAARRGLHGEKSYGLGLNICQQIVEAHEGRISVNSEEKLGTTFNIDLPIHETSGNIY